jgi:hypothetical protein
VEDRVMVSFSSSIQVRMGEEEEEGEGRAEETEERRASKVVSLETVRRRISPLRASLKVTVSKSICWFTLKI